MYIRRQDLDYFDRLFSSLDAEEKKLFLDLLRKAGSEKSGVEISKIRIIYDPMLKSPPVEQSEIMTRAMIKKAYREIKSNK